MHVCVLQKEDNHCFFAIQINLSFWYGYYFGIFMPL